MNATRPGGSQIVGDTEDIPGMRALKKIDVAFVGMESALPNDG